VEVVDKRKSSEMMLVSALVNKLWHLFCTFITFYIFDRNGDERVERPRPITVADLEARPGSPSIVVVPGSESSIAMSALDLGKKNHRNIHLTNVG
jgi:hypothetical protein